MIVVRYGTASLIYKPPVWSGEYGVFADGSTIYSLDFLFMCFVVYIAVLQSTLFH